MEDRVTTSWRRKSDSSAMIASVSPAEKSGVRGTTDRANYLIDRFRVGYEFGGGWSCGCREFASRNSCKHTREAEGRYAAQLRITQYLAQDSVEAFSPKLPVVSGRER